MRCSAAPLLVFIAVTCLVIWGIQVNPLTSLFYTSHTVTPVLAQTQRSIATVAPMPPKSPWQFTTKAAVTPQPKLQRICSAMDNTMGNEVSATLSGLGVFVPVALFVVSWVRRPRRASLLDPVVLQPTHESWALMAFTGKKTLLLPSLLGVAVTSYIILSKASLVPNFCSTSTCSDVLTGPFSSAFGVPIVVPAFAAYSILVLLALSSSSPLTVAGNGAAQSSLGDTETGTTDDAITESGGRKEATEVDWSAAAVLTLSTTMATVSAYLVSLLTFVLHQFCPLCFTSAAASTAACATAWTQGWADAVPMPQRRACLRSAIVLGLVGSGLHFYSGSSQAVSVASSEGGPFAPPMITTHSSEQALAIASRLQAVGARMYGAYWCSHCYGQKQTLGLEAFERLAYVECDANGFNSQRETCKAQGVAGYPTWQIQNTLLPGEKSLEELEAIVEAAERGEDLEVAAEAAFNRYWAKQLE